MPIASAVCECCESAFEYEVRGGRPRRYCSYACGYQHRRHGRGTEATCKACGEQFLANKDRKHFCSYDCRGRCQSLDGRSSSVTVRPCEFCTEPFVTRLPFKRFCSDSCNQRQKHWRVNQVERFTSCPECGTKMDRLTGKWIKDFCSLECGKRYHRRLRKFRMQTAPLEAEAFSTLEIARRDGWRCHICAEPVDRTTWSIDHLLPVSRGGSHTRSNVALAHKNCNARRGNRLETAVGV